MSPLDNLRVVLAGNGLAAIYALRQLLERRSTEVLVIAPPGGRAHSWNPSLAEVAQDCRVPLTTPENVNSPAHLTLVEHFAPDVLFSVHYTQVFAPEALAIPRLGCINFHPSLLPAYRGVAPLVWQIVNDEIETGITAHFMTSSVDRGDIIHQEPFSITPADTGYSLSRTAARVFRDRVFPRVYEYVRDGRIPRSPQKGKGSHFRRSDATLNDILWTQPARRIHNIIRALTDPFPCAYTILRGERVELVKSSVFDEETVGPVPGEILGRDDEAVRVATGQGVLRITHVRANQHVVTAADWEHTLAGNERADTDTPAGLV